MTHDLLLQDSSVITLTSGYIDITDWCLHAGHLARSPDQQLRPPLMCMAMAVP